MPALTRMGPLLKERHTMDEIIEILESLKPGVDYETAGDLVDSRVLDSLTILALVPELEDAFDVTIPAVEIVPANFNSVQAIDALVTRLVEEDA